MFRQAAGALFNAAPEQDLGRRLYGEILGGEVGMGFEPVPSELIESLTPYFQDGSPYIVYLGRKETGKNVHLLIDYFTRCKDEGVIPAEIKLVVAGGGSFSDLHRPEALKRGDVVDLQHVSELDKKRILRQAHPSSRALSLPALYQRILLYRDHGGLAARSAGGRA
jgi:glycosyltransferase involved in cell wall biosynthesis